MVATTRTALFGAFASIVAAQSVDIFLPEYGRYEDSLVAQSVGENAGVTTYLVGCGPQTVTSEYCLPHPTGVGRDNSPPLCTGDLPYKTYTSDSCVLTAGATLLEGPSTIVFIDGGSDGYSVDCSAAGTVSAVCTLTFTDSAFQTNNVEIDTISGSEYSFYHVPLTTGLTANGALPTLKAGGPASTTSAVPSTSSTASSSLSNPTASTPTAGAGTTSNSGSHSGSNSAGSSSGAAASSGSFSFGSGVTSNTTMPATNVSSSATATPPVAVQTDNAAASLGQWMVGAAAAAMVAVAAAL